MKKLLFFLLVPFLLTVVRHGVQAQNTFPTKTPTPTATMTPTPPPGKNIAKDAEITTSSRVGAYEDKTRLVDGNYSTGYNTYGVAPVKLFFNLKAKKTISAVMIVVEQSIPNSTTHKIYMGESANPTTLYSTITQRTQTGSRLFYIPEKPIENVQYVTIELSSSYYTGAWKEIEIYEASSETLTPSVTLTVSPTLTTSPSLSPTQSPTITQPASCVCNQDNTCDSSCVYQVPSCPEGATCPSTQMKCARESSIGPTPGAEAKNGYCRSAKRFVGDADGNGIVDALDYLYYVRAVNGGQIPDTVNPDFNGDGYVSPSDRVIIIATLGQGSDPVPSITNTPTVTPSPTRAIRNTEVGDCGVNSCLTTQECFVSGGIPSSTTCSGEVGKFCCIPR